MLHAFLLILVGLAGDPEHGELFHKWGGELADAAGKLGVPAEHVVYLVDQQTEGEAHVSGKATVEEINKQGTPILLVEQNALMALDVADRGYVLETGHIALADDAKKLRENEQVQKTYLGVD